MRQKTFLRLAATIFAVISLAHLARVAVALPITIGQWTVPMWLSWLAFLVAGSLSIAGGRLARWSGKDEGRA